MQNADRQATHSSYLDFELEIGLGRGREYPVEVVNSPAGEAHETMRFPYDELVLESRLKDLQIALLRSGGERRRMPSPEELAVQEFGQSLFDALLSGEVRSRYDVSLREAAQQGKGLRLKLRIQSPKLAALPWEYLYDSRQAEYVSLSRNTPIVRYLELSQPPRSLAVTPPLRILGMVAAPHDLSPLDMAREKGRIERATQNLRSHKRVELTWMEGQTWRDLQQAMWGGPWHIFHFIGHGGFDHSTDEGFVVLVGEDGRSNRLSATLLGRLLADHPSLRLVLLNSCEGARSGERDIFSSAAAILVRRGVSAVVAMQYEITDQAAIEFAQAFYGALTYGKPVDEAIVEARKAISLAVANTVEWGTPVLHMRSPDGTLFDIQRGALEPRPPAIARPPKPERSESNVAQRWLRSLPLAAGIGLLVLLLVLAGALGVWLGGGVIRPSIAPTVVSSPTVPPEGTSTQLATPAETPEPTRPPTEPVGGLTLSMQRVLYPHAQKVRHVAFSPDGSRLVSGAESMITLWGAQTGWTLVAIKIGTPARAPDVAFSPDGQRVAGMVNRVVMLWDAETGDLLREFEGHTGYPVSLAFSPDGSRLVSGGEDWTAIVWNTETGEQVAVLTAADAIGGVAFAPDGTTFAAGSIPDVLLAKAETGGQFLILKGHTAGVNDVAFSSDGRKLASASTDGTVIVWEVGTGQSIYRLPAASGAVHGVAFSPDGSLLAAGTERGRILVWEMSTGDLLVKFDAHEEEVYDVAFSPDGKTLASASADTTVGLWNVR